MTDSTISLIERLKAGRSVWDNGKARPTDAELEAAAELTKLRAAMTEAARMLKHDYSHDDDGYGVAEYLERILGGGE